MSEMDLTPRNDAPDGSVAPKKKRNVVPMLVLTAVLVAGGVIVTQFLNSAVDYFCNVDEVGVRDGCEEERRIRLQGTVEAGTIDKSVPGVTAFKMAFGDAEIDVSYDGIPGGIFKECIPVVVHGEIRNGVLEGDLVEVKHSDEYVSVNDDNLLEADEFAEVECPDEVTA
ncbi:MAG: cytochrome c maturation protein CcmE [Ilumatobacter sp.]